MANHGRSSLLWFALATVVLLWVAGCSGFFVNATLTSILVSPSSATVSLAAGTKQQFTATGIFSDGSTQVITTTVTWASSDSTVATISNTAPTNGLASPAGKTGMSTNITETSGGVVSTAAVLTVNP